MYCHNLLSYVLDFKYLTFKCVIIRFTQNYTLEDSHILSTYKMVLAAVCTHRGRAMAQAVSRRPLTADARVRSRLGPCGICGGRSSVGIGFSPSTSVFPCQFHSTRSPLKWKSRRNIFIFITGLHNKPSRLRCVRSFCCEALQ